MQHAPISMGTPRSSDPSFRPLGARVACLLALAGVVACAQGSEISDESLGGTGGAGGASASSGASTGDSSTASSSAASSTSASSTTAAGSTSASSSASTSASSSSGGPMCDSDEHLCGGICAGNTTQTGCFQSVTCAPCAAPPIHGTSTCSAAGLCDFTCGSGYTKSGNSCVCDSECCSDADCANGASCSGGTCSDPPPPPCDDNACILECAAFFCVGICLGDTCTCFC